MNNTIKHMREAKSSANCTSWGNKIVSVVLSVVLLGFGWPAVNPAEVYAEDSAANAGGSYQLAGDSASNATSTGEGADTASRADGESAGSSSPALAGMESDAAGDSGDPNTPSTTNSTTSKGAANRSAPRTPWLRSLSITGADTVAQFSTAQLTGTTSPANAEGTYVWSSNNDNILTVDQSGMVTGVRKGSATVTLSYTSPDGNTTLAATHDVTVTSPTAATNSALF